MVSHAVGWAELKEVVRRVGRLFTPVQMKIQFGARLDLAELPLSLKRD